MTVSFQSDLTRKPTIALPLAGIVASKAAMGPIAAGPMRAGVIERHGIAVHRACGED